MSNVLTNGVSQVDTYLTDLAKTLEECFPLWDTGRPREWALDMQFEKLIALNPGRYFVPIELGGLGASVGESLVMFDLVSYHRLSFGLAIGINSALFIWPLNLFGSAAAKATVFRKIRSERKIGGLMLTEPSHGSDLLNMEAKFTRRDGSYHVTGIKHWAGLTGRADYWLIAARSGEVERGRQPIGFFLCEQDNPSERTHVECYYDSAGLQPITYGRSRLDVVVPESHRLRSSHQGLDILRTTLTHSRMVICAMASGAVRRLRDESIGFASGRMIGRRSLLSYDLTQFFIRQLDARLAVLSALCRYLSRTWDLDVATAEQFEAARIVKVVATDYMTEASDRAVQIFASAGYRNSAVPWISSATRALSESSKVRTSSSTRRSAAS